MLSLWLKTKTDDVYLVKTCQRRTPRYVIRFLAELGVSRQGDFDIESLLPHLELPPWPLREEEREELRSGTLVAQFDCRTAARDRELEERLTATYRMELEFVDGSQDRAVGSLVEMQLLTELLRASSDVPAPYRNSDGELRVALPGDILGVGRVERLGARGQQAA